MVVIIAGMEESERVRRKEEEEVYRGRGRMERRGNEGEEGGGSRERREKEGRVCEDLLRRDKDVDSLHVSQWLTRLVQRLDN